MADPVLVRKGQPDDGWDYGLPPRAFSASQQSSGTSDGDWDYGPPQSGNNAAPEKPGFLKRLGQSFGLPTSKEELQGMAAREDALPWYKKIIPHAPGQEPGVADLLAGPGAAQAGRMIGNWGTTAAKGLREGWNQADEADQELNRGGISMKQALGKTADAALHSTLQATPIVGPSIETAGTDIAQGNYRGAAGGLTGVIGQIAAPELVKRGAPVAGRAFKGTAGAINNAVIDASGRATQYGQNPGLGMAAEGVTGWKPGTIAQRLKAPMAARGQQLTDLYSSPALAGTSVDLTGAIEHPFEQALAEATDPTTGVAPKALVRRIGSTQAELTNNPATGEPRDFSAVSPEDALQIKRNLGDRTKFNKAEYSEGVNDILRKVGGNIKSTLNAAVPEGIPLNQRLSDLYSAQDVLSPQAMNYKSGHLWSNAPANLVRGVGTNLASGLYKIGEGLSPDNLPTAATMPMRGPTGIPANVTPGNLPQQPQLPAGQYAAPASPVRQFALPQNSSVPSPIQLPSQMEPIENVGPISQNAARGLPSRGAGGRMQRTFTNASTFERPPVMTIDGPTGQIVEGQGGGHAGGGVSSAEELNRSGVNYTVSKGGQISYHGKSFAPESTPRGSTHVTVLPDGSFRVNAGQTLSAGQELALKNALKK